MNNFSSILASALLNYPHLVAFDRMVKERFSGIALDVLLVYLIDTVPAASLPFLAEQFDVLGYKGWKLAKTEMEQRELIKRSIELHRYKGTVWAVKEAIKTIGYPDAELIEHVQTGQNGWATFRILLAAGDKKISAGEIEELKKMVNCYKNARSHLADLSYTIDFFDAISLLDESFEAPAVDEFDGLFIGGDFRHNGQYRRDGTRNYSLDTDVLTIQIINV